MPAKIHNSYSSHCIISFFDGAICTAVIVLRLSMFDEKTGL